MKLDKRHLLLYALTDSRWLAGESLYDQVEQALQGGVTLLQYREKTLNHDQRLAQALAIKPLCARYNVPFILNDHPRLAAQIDADGLHIGQNDIPLPDARAYLGAGKIIGVSAHTVAQAITAERQGADYLGVGAIFPTDIKPDAHQVDYQTLQAICQAVRIPVVAIGGITAENMPQLAGSGICGVALISAIFANPPVRKTTRALARLAARVTQQPDEAHR